MAVAAGIGYRVTWGCFGACRECGFFMVKLLPIEFGKWNFGQMIGLSSSQVH